MIANSGISWSLCRYIEINYDLHLWEVHASGKHVGRYDDTDLFRLEFRNHLITLSPVHISENDSRFHIFFSHHVVKCLSKFLRIYENDCLSHLALSKDLLHEFWLLAFLTTVFELLNMVQRQIFLFEHDLLCMSNEG